METTIKIKAIGYKAGTVGWLAAGLQNGTIELSEGTLKSNGNHGLWIKSGQVSQLLAARDRYDVGDQLASARRYEHVDREDRNSIWTDAAWGTLMQIAADWCEQCNAIRDAGEPETIAVVRSL